MQPPKDEKYVVIKRQDWNDWVLDGCPNEGLKIVEDAVVIRRQDVFAPPALDAYANSITVAVEALDVYDTSKEGVQHWKGLRSIADYFHAQATAAWDAKRKLPD